MYAAQKQILLSLLLVLFAGSCKQIDNNNSSTKAEQLRTSDNDCTPEGIKRLQAYVDSVSNVPRPMPSIPPLDGVSPTPSQRPLTSAEKDLKQKQERRELVESRITECYDKMNTAHKSLYDAFWSKRFEPDYDLNDDDKGNYLCHGKITTSVEEILNCKKTTNNDVKGTTGRCPSGYYWASDKCYPNSLLPNAGSMTSCPAGQILTTAGTCAAANYKELYDHCLNIGAVLYTDNKCHKNGQILP